MGGKIAIQLTAIAPQRLQQLVVLDMAPFAYQEHHHDQIFQALFAVEQAQIESRKDAQTLCSISRREMISSVSVEVFLSPCSLFRFSQLICRDILSGRST